MGDRFKLQLRVNKENYLDDSIGEFPRLDERKSCLNTDMATMPLITGSRLKVSFNSIASYDFETDKKDSFTLSEFDAVGEPIFVPKSLSANEGEGYLLSLAFLDKKIDLI